MSMLTYVQGCLKHCPCVCVGVINAQQAGGETDGEVCLWMLGLFQPTFLHIHATPSSAQYYEQQCIKVPICLFFDCMNSSQLHMYAW